MNAGDLHRVAQRLREELYENQLADWLSSPNGFLGGAMPIDMIELGQVDRVLQAIEAMAEGAYARALT